MLLFSIFICTILISASANAQLLPLPGDSVIYDYTPERSLIIADSIPEPIILPNTTDLDADTLLSTDVLDTAKQDIDSAKVAKKGDIETTIKYTAKDSIRLDMPKMIVELYGDAKIIYGNIELEAAEIQINYATKIITAKGVPDTLGVMQGKPVFKEGAETYYTDEMMYNFDTKKAVIKGVVTQQGDANMRGTRVFKNQFDELYIADAIYTTCNMADPHFHISSKKIKLIPNNKVVAGPARMYVMGMPTPAIVPFGIFPMPKKKASGVLVPTYGEERRRGFFLRNGGYYFAINDYADLQVTSEIYSKGSWGLSTASSYKKLYSYNGRFNMRYNSQRTGSEIDSIVSKDFWVNWSHTPESKGTGRFSASVDGGTRSYNQNNPRMDLSNTLNQELSSSVNYSKTFQNTPFNMSANARLQQNVSTGVVNATLPDLAVNMNRIYPLKKRNASAKTWYENLSFSWNMNSTNRLTNNRLGISRDMPRIFDYNPEADTVLPFGFGNIRNLLDRAQTGVRHKIPISTSTKVMKHFTLSPAFNYDEIWYFKELNYRWIDSENALKVDTVSNFNRLYFYNSSIALNTNIYGTVYFKKSRVQAIRHVMRPSMTMSYAPDFSVDRFNFFQEIQTDSLGRMQRFSKFNGFVFNTPTPGPNGSISISVSNNIEAKVKSKSDTGEVKSEKVSIIDNLSFSANYNLLADSFNLQPANIAFRSRIINKKVDINFSTTLDPYTWELDSIFTNRSGDLQYAQRRRPIYAWNAGRGLGQFTRAALALSMSLNPQARKNEQEADQEIDDNVGLSPEEEAVRQFVRNNPELYVDFSVPWNLRINYNVAYAKQGFNPGQISNHSMMFSGDLSLTEQWKIAFNSGYDILKKQFTQTNFNISRDLHCWQMAFTWTPFGRFQSYNLSIHAKSSLLQDLKVNRQRSWWDN
ncbi:MAG: putative LPS assembly protein LptD [Cyclobacteriaceae bacterium]